MSAHLSPSKVAELAVEPGDGDPHLSQCSECQQQLETFLAALATMKRGYEPPEEPAFARSKAIAAAVSSAAESDERELDLRAWFQRPSSWLLATVPLAMLAVAVWWPRAGAGTTRGSGRRRSR